MDFSLEEADLAVRARARRLARTLLLPAAREADEEARFDARLVKQLGQEGLLGGVLPKAYGGRGWSELQGVLSLMELGAVDSSWRGFVTVQTCLCGQLLLEHASPQQKRELLPGLASGTQIFAYALTEEEAGSDVRALSTRARREGEGWRLDGSKVWITNGRVAHWILLFARVEGEEGGDSGLTCFLVPGDTPGLHREAVPGQHLGHRGADHARLDLCDVHLPASAVVGGVGRGFEVAMGGLAHGRLGVAAGAVGIQQACLELALDFVRHRRQFGRRIGDFQLIQELVTDLHVALEATRLLTLKAAWLSDQGRSNTRQTAVAKYAASEAAVRAADQVILLHGSRGYASTCPAGRLYRDAKGLQIYEGTSHIQRIIIARDLIGKEIP